jgi:hypothetical protein
MEDLARSKNTPGTDASFDLLSRVAVGPEGHDRYPSGTLLIPSDSPDASALIAGATAERRPMAVVFPDGSDLVARPPRATGFIRYVVLAALSVADRASKRRDRPTFVPREWVTEFHAAPKKEPELVPRRAKPRRRRDG